MTIVNTARADHGILADRFEGIRAALRRHQVYRRTLVELNDLDDRELADIGLHRANLREIALEAAAQAR